MQKIAKEWGSVALFAMLTYCFALSGTAHATQRVLMITGERWVSTGSELSATLQGRGAQVSHITPTSTGISELMTDFARSVRPGDDVTIVLRCHGSYENADEVEFASDPSRHICGLRFEGRDHAFGVTARQIRYLINNILHPQNGRPAPNPLPRINVIVESCYGGAMHRVLGPFNRQVCTMSFSGPRSPTFSGETQDFEQNWSASGGRSPMEVGNRTLSRNLRDWAYNIISRPIASSCAASIAPLRDSLAMGLHQEIIERVAGVPSATSTTFNADFGSCDPRVPSPEFMQATQVVRTMGNFARIDQVMQNWVSQNCHRFTALGRVTVADCSRLNNIAALRSEVVRRIQEVSQADRALRTSQGNRGGTTLDSLESELELKLLELNPFLRMFEDAYCAAITPPDDPCVTHRLP